MAFPKPVTEAMLKRQTLESRTTFLMVKVVGGQVPAKSGQIVETETLLDTLYIVQQLLKAKMHSQRCT